MALLSAIRRCHERSFLSPFLIQNVVSLSKVRWLWSGLQFLSLSTSHNIPSQHPKPAVPYKGHFVYLYSMSSEPMGSHEQCISIDCEVLGSLAITSCIWWDVVPCSACKCNRRFVGAIRANILGRGIRQARKQHDTTREP
jgi:hypothetical protein